MLLPRRTKAQSRANLPPPVAPDASFIAVGDIHGSMLQLQRLLAAIEQAGRGDVTLVFVGDYIDRGPDSLGVLRCLSALERERGKGCVCLLGNHEDMLLDFLDRPAAGPRWALNGGFETLISCGLDPVARDAPDSEWALLRDRLMDALGEELEAWLRDLPPMWRSGNVAVVHAGADPAVPLGLQKRRHLVWGHPEFMTVPRSDGRWVVHGHTITEEPELRNARIAIDTGAYATGRLTAALVEPGLVSFMTV
ncbi:serine/threonine protein phosphatase [Thioclava sp. BHET1]|nr:serine/threonine protein phosphatase [Thioclava sp. BHET1]